MTATVDHPARASDPQTSHDAARIPRPTLVGDVRRILAAYPNGLTDDQLWQKTGLSYARHGSVVKARKATGAVARTDVYGKSLSNSRCSIWVLPEVTA